MAQSQLANVKEELGVTEAYVEELAVALAHERETVAKSRGTWRLRSARCAALAFARHCQSSV